MLHSKCAHAKPTWLAPWRTEQIHTLRRCGAESECPIHLQLPHHGPSAESLTSILTYVLHPLPFPISVLTRASVFHAYRPSIDLHSHSLSSRGHYFNSSALVTPRLSLVYRLR